MGTTGAVKWSDAYPGLSIIEDSSLADSWSQRMDILF